MTRFIMKFLALVMFLSLLPGTIWAQQLLSGRVTNQSGEPLIGVNILVTGTNSGTLTDIDGNYSLNVPVQADSITVTFSYIGFRTQEKNITDWINGTLNIQLASDIMLFDEIVVTGPSAGTSRKQLGNAISTLDAKDFELTGATGLDQALSGKLTGTLVNQNSGNPAGGISITMRGNSTVFGGSDPLYIIDGVIVDNSSPELVDLGGYAQNRLVDINPNDIAKVEIIKGAAAAAIYGSRASNGVVNIVTKKGIDGKPQVTFSTSLRVNELRKEIEENMEPFIYRDDNTANELVPTKRFKMQDFIFSSGVGTDNNLSIRGGKGDTRYFFSGSAFSNEGIIDNTSFNRYTGRLNLDQVFNSWISGSVGLNYTYSQSSEVPNGGLGAFYGALTGFNFNQQ